MSSGRPSRGARRSPGRRATPAPEAVRSAWSASVARGRAGPTRGRARARRSARRAAPSAEPERGASTGALARGRRAGAEGPGEEGHVARRARYVPVLRAGSRSARARRADRSRLSRGVRRAREPIDAYASGRPTRTTSLPTGPASRGALGDVDAARAGGAPWARRPCVAPRPPTKIPTTFTHRARRARGCRRVSPADGLRSAATSEERVGARSSSPRRSPGWPAALPRGRPVAAHGHPHELRRARAGARCATRARGRRERARAIALASRAGAAAPKSAKVTIAEAGFPGSPRTIARPAPTRRRAACRA